MVDKTIVNQSIAIGSSGGGSRNILILKMLKLVIAGRSINLYWGNWSWIRIPQLLHLVVIYYLIMGRFERYVIGG